MDLSEFEHRFFSDLAMLCEDHKLAGIDLRPLSLCSDRALELMGLTLMEETPDYSVMAEEEQILAYIWLHSAPLPEVTWGIVDGAWKKKIQGVDDIGNIVEEFREHRIRRLSMLAATDFTIKPHPDDPKDDTPKDVIGPYSLAFEVAMIAHHIGVDPDRVRWHMFLPQARQHFLAALRWNHLWTIRCPHTVTDAETADYAPTWMRPSSTPPATP